MILSTRVLELRAATAEERDQWMDTLDAIGGERTPTAAFAIEKRSRWFFSKKKMAPLTLDGDVRGLLWVCGRGCQCGFCAWVCTCVVGGWKGPVWGGGGGVGRFCQDPFSSMLCHLASAQARRLPFFTSCLPPVPAFRQCLPPAQEVMSGWLEKKGRKRHSWKRRWCVCFRDRLVYMVEEGMPLFGGGGKRREKAGKGGRGGVVQSRGWVETPNNRGIHHDCVHVANERGRA